jgi:hypothetical protein
VGTLVAAFNMSLDDAWGCTVREFWEIMEVHMIRTGQKKPPGEGLQSADDVRAMEEHLREMGIIE